jgi:hypothetical protein
LEKFEIFTGRQNPIDGFELNNPGFFALICCYLTYLKTGKGTMDPFQAFIEAAHTGDIMTLERMLAMGLFKANAQFNRALREAAGNGHEEMVGLLLQDEKVVKNVDDLNNDSLLRAARGGHQAVVKQLLKHKAVALNAAIDNNKILLDAVERGHLSVVDMLLENEVVVQKVASENNRILNVAGRRGDTAIIARLLSFRSVREDPSFVGICRNYPIIQETLTKIMQSAMVRGVWEYGYDEENERNDSYLSMLPIETLLGVFELLERDLAGKDRQGFEFVREEGSIQDKIYEDCRISFKRR